MNKQFILVEEQKIFEELNINAEAEKNLIITDGIIDIDEYLDSEYKILWINKEVNSEDEDEGWDLKHTIAHLCENGRVKKGWDKTFNPIIYIVYGIFNNLNYEDIPNSWDRPEIIDYLKKIAYINVKKLPGKSVANLQELIDFHSKHSQTIEKQILLYNPDIIICGNTYNLVEKLLDKIYDKGREITFEIDNKEKANILYYNKELIIVDAYHPSHRINKEKYCDGIINGVLNWIKYKNKP